MAGWKWVESAMARPREFDEEAVLDAATLCFWTRGYDGASTRDLAEQMGITGASLYNAYGDKRALYRLVLDRYANQALVWCAGALTTDQPAGRALETFFAALGAETLGDSQRRRWSRTCLSASRPYSPPVSRAAKRTDRSARSSRRRTWPGCYWAQCWDCAFWRARALSDPWSMAWCARSPRS
jgi:AcrR family transcriptional regulator